MLVICGECAATMPCDKNSVGWDYGNGHVYPSDRFKCLHCGHTTLVTNDKPSYDPDYKFQEEYLTVCFAD
jgi:hypothetical protein